MMNADEVHMAAQKAQACGGSKRAATQDTRVVWPYRVGTTLLGDSQVQMRSSQIDQSGLTCAVTDYLGTPFCDRGYCSKNRMQP